MKIAVAHAYPEGKPGAIPGWASILVKFAYRIQPADRLVAPNKCDRTLNFGVVDGPYEFHPEVSQHYHRRRVRWVKTGVPRSLFPQAALFEIGSAITLFQVRRHADVFGHYFDARSDDTLNRTGSV
jgi:restriction system protein